MRLLMTTDTIGGVWTYTTSLVPELLSREVAVALVTVGPAPSAAQLLWLEQTAVAWGEAFHWEVCSAPLEWMNENKHACVDAEALLLLVAREFGAELLHSNQFCFGALPLSLPKLVVAHSDVLSWAAACRKRPLPPSAWLNRYCALTATGLLGADAVVAPTRWMLNALAANFVLPSARQVIPNGHTLVGAEGEPERQLQAVTAGRLWDEAKNLRLLEQVHASIPLLVAGETECGAQKAPATGAAVSLLGMLDQTALLALFRQSAIYMCLSQYEPFGLAPLEAALAGCAVLANDIPSLREVWGDGALYFCGAHSLSQRLAQLSEHPEQLAAAQRRSWQRARQYTAAATADQYLALYHSLLAPVQAATHVA